MATPTPTPTPTTEASLPTAGTGYLSGALYYPQPADPSADREVVVTLLEESQRGSRVIPTTTYLGGGSSPLGFVAAFDWAMIDPAADYRVLAAVVDGEDSWYTLEGVPVITHDNPMAGLLVPVYYRADILEGQVTGIVLGTPPDLSASAIRETFLVRADTGAVVGYDAAWVEDPRLLPFSVPFLIDDIEPSVAYEVVGRVVDGSRFWTGPGVPVITFGAPLTGVIVPVSEQTDPSAPLAEPEG
jgi:uncharacterized lipoprotein YbaY